MSSYTLSWSRAVGDGSTGQTTGGSKADATLEGMLSNLKKTLNKSGSVSLAVIDGPEIGPQLLQVETQGGKSLLTLGEDTGEDYIVRHYVQSDDELKQFMSEPEKIRIFGKYWNKNIICTNKEIVAAVFVEFYETGDVSKDLLE